ncbi:hypothetical protein [Aeromicrobium alkaliterrae]|uniref:Uncharacterized protein n=1 Tax=Aeromicrobium alkaliterrae TaxID=302168 RepID=A0ABP4VGN5_9ACTN
MSRPTSARERAALTAMLSVDFDGVEKYRAQVETVRVSGTCGCGCLTIDFAHPGTKQGVTLLTEAYTDSALIMLFANDGRLSCLEYAPLGDDVAMPDEFPLPPELQGITVEDD